MPRTGTCTGGGEETITKPLPNGSGYVTCDFTWSHDGTSVWPNCDGPVQGLTTKNTGNIPAWAKLPDKKQPPQYVRIDPDPVGTTISAKGQLANLGLSNRSDLITVDVVFAQPGA